MSELGLLPRALTGHRLTLGDHLAEFVKHGLVTHDVLEHIDAFDLVASFTPSLMIIHDAPERRARIDPPSIDHLGEARTVDREVRCRYGGDLRDGRFGAVLVIDAVAHLHLLLDIVVEELRGGASPHFVIIMLLHPHV